jgi:hypothetical protein
MPAFSIFKMLVDGRLLPGVIVLTTSRPMAQQIFQKLNFDRTVEILGFFEEQIKNYVSKFCENNNDTAELIWNQLQESAELLSLCYIPVNRGGARNSPTGGLWTPTGGLSHYALVATPQSCYLNVTFPMQF